MQKRVEDMSREELVAELVRLEPVRFDASHGAAIAAQELETYKEETRIQTEQLIEAQRLLEESRDRYADLYETVPIANLTLDQQGVIRDINLTGARLLGRERGEIIDRPLVRFVAERDRRTWLDHLRLLGQTQADQLTCEFSLHTGGDVAVEAISRPLERDTGPIYRVALVDLSEQKRAEREIRQLNQGLEQRVSDRTAELEEANEKLRTADRRKNEFLAMLGHEMRNPLASIASGLEVLHLGAVSGREQSETLRIMQRQVKNLTALLNDLLDVSRVTLGKISLHKHVHDVNEMLESAIESCREMIAARRHQLEFALCREPCQADCDRARVEQMIVNLVHNAVKYTDPGGCIRLLASREGDDVRIDVCDTGCGMPEEVRQGVFELFTQADATLDRSQGGLGLGLTMVKSLAELHGGRVQAYSDGPGQGSRFSIWLPVTTTSVSRSTAADSPSSQAEPSRLRIVIVEDNVDSAQLISLLLRRWGHQVELAHNGLDGLETIRRVRPQVAIIDIGLPGIDGFALARRLREEFTADELHLVALTGYGGDGDREQAAQAGFDVHLTKPVSFEELRVVLSGS